MADNGIPDRVEQLTALLLSVAGLTTAWASYQAALWNGEQISHYSEANGHLTVASKLDLQAGQHAAVDTILFGAWIAATDAGRADRARFLEDRFSGQFAAAFADWRRQLDRPEGSGTPQSGSPAPKMPVPVYSESREAEARRTAASRAFAAGDRANRAGNAFVAATVLLSTVLFLGGISQILKRPRLRLAVLGLAYLIGLLSMVWLSTLPIAPF